MKNPSALIFFVLFAGQLFAQTTCIVNVDQNTIVNPAAKKLLGTSFDSRSSINISPTSSIIPGGYYDPTSGIIIPEVQPLWNRVPMHGVRYPGNPVLYNWNWSYTIGPVVNRQVQYLGPGLTPQALAFGFDEFMDMCSARGLASDDVQIMVNIYSSTGQSNPAILAADWVEYCNAPNDGSNPRQGTDWAALRAQYGHQQPYNIRIWNIGNEPWGPNELGSTSSGATNYINIASPIIDSMLAADPTIHITIPAVGNGTSQWNSTILSSSLMGRIYALSPHSFYDEDANTSNPSVAQVQALFTNVAATASSHGLKIIIGDQAAFAPANNPDIAMQWRGALTTANNLIMLSQLSNVELANFWIYGNPKAVWHPIRYDANTDIYTLMAAAQLYETFSPVFLDKSLSTTTVDNTGNPVTTVRSAGFISNDAMNASVIVVNTDTINDNEVVTPVLTGFTLQSTRKIYGETLLADTLKTISVIAEPNGNFELPKASILIFEYTADLSTSIDEPEETIFLYPNPSTGRIIYNRKNLYPGETWFISVIDVTGKTILKQQSDSLSGVLDLSGNSAGIYSLSIQNENSIIAVKKIVLQK